MIYGMNEQKLLKAKYKIKANKAYMKSHGIVLNDKIIPFSDFVANSYINSDRYIAELQHRAWSIYEYAKLQQLQNVFVTITLPSQWHPMKQKSKFDKTMVFNKKFGGRKYIKITTKQSKLKFDLINAHVVQNIPFIDPILDYSKTRDRFTPKNASKELSKLLKKIFDDSLYKNIKSDDRCYFRVIEPHKSGTPHLHISFFIPSDKVEAMEELVKRKFPKKQSKVETNVNRPVSYLLKYVLKTLDDLRRPDADLTALSLWYVYHGISRFYTSRTFVALDVYRSLKGMYTLNELTQSYENNEISVYLDTKTNKIARIDNQYATIYSQKVIQETFKNSKWREDMENEDNTYFEYEFETIKTVDKEPLMVVYEFEGQEYIKQNGLLVRPTKQTNHGTHYESKHGLVIEPTKQPVNMGDVELYDYYQNLDKNIETVNIARYGNVKNMCIKRGLIKGEVTSLDEYTKDIFVYEPHQKPYNYYSASNLGLIEKTSFVEVF
jgi:hypothetical protein